MISSLFSKWAPASDRVCPTTKFPSPKDIHSQIKCNWDFIEKVFLMYDSLWSLQVMKQWERKVRSASSLDELLRLADFPDWKLWKCRMRLQQPETQTETLSSPPSAGSHRSTRYAAESYSLEILRGWIKNTAYVSLFKNNVFQCGCEHCPSPI